MRTRRYAAGSAAAAVVAVAVVVVLVNSPRSSVVPAGGTASVAPSTSSVRTSSAPVPTDDGGQGAVLSPEVRHVGGPPTGYEVTFRYRGPASPNVKLKGEWYFSRPGHTQVGNSEGLLPSQWKPGDFPIGWPNFSTTAGWPVMDMTRGPDGVWSATVPLPSGEFDYAFVLGCTAKDELESASSANCLEIADPSNPPWNEHDGVTSGSVEPSSQVYVPSDPAFHTVDYSWQAPTSPRGALRDVYYPALVGSDDSPPGLNKLAIYTPPGYDPHRAKPYPTLYLSHGFGPNEVDWSTRADAANILDNLINTGRAEPMVAVMTNFAFIDCQIDDATRYGDNLIGSVIPYIESHYFVSRQASRRAFAGLSCGGGLAAALLLHHTSAFAAFGLFSPNSYPVVVSRAQARAIRRVRVMIGVGKEDPIHQYSLEDLATLRQAGVTVFPDLIDGGHDWYVWRILLHDFLAHVAFKPAG